MIEQSQIKALAFDFDGVLADSLPIKDRALQGLFRVHTQDHDDVENRALAVWNRQKGVFRRERLRVTFREVVGLELEGTALNEQVRLYSEAVFEKTVASPWIAGAQEFLLAAPNQPCYIVSAAPQEEVREVVRRRNMGRFFRSVYGGPEKKWRLLTDIIEKEGCAAAELLFIGDSISDHVAAETVQAAFLGVVAPGLNNPFPTWRPTVADLTGLAALL